MLKSQLSLPPESTPPTVASISSPPDASESETSTFEAEGEVAETYRYHGLPEELETMVIRVEVDWPLILIVGKV